MLLRGALPVRIVAWAVQVTAGTTSSSGRTSLIGQFVADAGRSGKQSRVRPTALIRTSGCNSMDPPLETGESSRDQGLQNNTRVRLHVQQAALPPYTYVPGGPWPHPTHSPDGHSWGRHRRPLIRFWMISGDLRPQYLQGRAVQRGILLGSP